MATLLTEALVVGVLMGAALALLAWLSPRLFSQPLRAGAAGLLLGAAFHLAFEASGLNAMYCRTGHACLQK